MPGDASQYALKNLLWFTRVNGTAAFVGKSYNTIHVLELTPEVCCPKPIPDIIGYRSRTVDAGDDGHVIACAHPSVRTSVTREVTHPLRRKEIHRPDFSAEIQVALEVLDGDIMGMDMLTCSNAFPSMPNNLSVLPHGDILRNLLQRDLMSRADQLSDVQVDAAVEQLVSPVTQLDFAPTRPRCWGSRQWVLRQAKAVPG